MTNRQAATARFLLGWSPERLAQESNIPVSSVYLFIRLGSAGLEHDALMRAAFERAGIEFPHGATAAVRLRGSVEIAGTRDDSAPDQASNGDSDALAANRVDRSDSMGV